MDADTPTPVPCTQEEYDALLAWCRERAHEAGVPEPEVVPAGRAGEPYDCPCAMSAPGLYVGTLTWGRGAMSFVPLPPLVRAVIRRIDEHPTGTLVQPVVGVTGGDE